MPRHGSVSDLTPEPIPFEVSDVVSMPIELQVENLNEALANFEEDLLNLNEAIVTQARRQVRAQTEGCQQAARAFLEVKYRLHDVLGGEPS